MKKAFVQYRLLIVFYLLCSSVSGQNYFWSDVSEAAISTKRTQRSFIPKKYRTLLLDTSRLTSFLRKTPKEFSSDGKNNQAIVTLPFPDGSIKRFLIVETSMMEQGLAVQFPNIKTYGGQGIDDPYATIKIDYTPLGFHAMILSPVNGSVFIDPYSQGSTIEYMSYNKSDAVPVKPFIENFQPVTTGELDRTISQRTTAVQCIGGVLRTYRLAVACTKEYARAVAGSRPVSVENALSAITTTINRVNDVYEKEVGVRLILVDSIRKIIFTNAENDPFTGNDNGSTLIGESQNVITTRIGAANFDIGHTFSTGGGGLADVGVVCNNSRKARGVTGSKSPVNDPFDIDYVAHEIGHQFGADHTFNAATGSCSGNGVPGTNAEPGSGSTIMAYAGICDPVNNLQSNSDPFFHTISFEQITGYSINDNGNNCAQVLRGTNRPPVVNAGSDYNIPKSTPFVLSGSATDPDVNDNNSLTYSWEEINVGGVFGNWNNPVGGNAPIFRSFVPQTTPVRYFPRMTDIIENKTSIGELLPTYARNLNFRLTVRDNRSGGGGICSDDVILTVNGNAGPFTVTATDSAAKWQVGTFQTITWNVANTNAAPISCTNVSIELSVDGGTTFTVVLAANTANDGIEEIKVPANVTTRARIRVKAVGNVFFAISNANFTIQPAAQTEFVFSNPQPVSTCNNSSASTTISTSGLNGFSTPITLSASGNPGGSSVVFTTNTVTPGNSVGITLQGTLQPGSYDINITGAAGSVTKTRVVQFIFVSSANAPVISSPADQTVINSLTPTFNWQSVPSATAYKLEISTSPAFFTTVQTINNITGTTHKLSASLTQNTEYYWRVSAKNLCGQGTASNSFLFKTAAISCDTTISTNVPVTIPEGVTTVNSTIDIQSGGEISDVNVVGLKGTHGYIGDLTVSLISPANTSVTLFNGVCNGFENVNFNMNFDDEAGSSTIPCPPFSGAIRKPVELLSAFDGQSSTGRWTLKITDNNALDGGTLTNWGLRICSYKPTTLPVNWLTFTANKTEKNTVSLQWSTANELNNLEYVIERSVDGVNFYSIGRINAGNNPATTQQYFFNDATPFNGANYYRLKQVDKDGKFNYSSIARIVLSNNKAVLYVVYPNPATDRSTIRVLSDLGKVSVRLNDAFGKVLYQTSLSSVRTGEEITIPLKGCSKGLYIITVTTEKGTTAEKIVVQ